MHLLTPLCLIRDFSRFPGFYIGVYFSASTAPINEMFRKTSIILLFHGIIYIVTFCFKHCEEKKEKWWSENNGFRGKIRQSYERFNDKFKSICHKKYVRCDKYCMLFSAEILLLQVINLTWLLSLFLPFLLPFCTCVCQMIPRINITCRVDIELSWFLGGGKKERDDVERHCQVSSSLEEFSFYFLPSFPHPSLGPSVVTL